MSGIERIVVDYERDCATPVRNSKDAAYTAQLILKFHFIRFAM